MDPKIEELQAVLLLARLPLSTRQIILGATVLYWEQAMAACFFFAGSGIHATLPCLARGGDGSWFTFIDGAPS
jgi:hypothetical protein